MSNCKSCGTASCCGDCEKSCIKVYRPTVWRDGQTGIPGDPGADGVGIINIVDNLDGTFTIFLSDATSYVITMPASPGTLRVVDILPVVGDDDQWELVYSDASTLVISAAYYILNDGTAGGFQLLYNQAAHPTVIRSLAPKGVNNKIVLEAPAGQVTYNVKQYGKSQSVSFEDNTGGGSYVTTNPPKYQLVNGTVGTVSAPNTIGGPITNEITDKYRVDILPIDAYKVQVSYAITHSFDFSFGTATFGAAIDNKYSFWFNFNLSSLGAIPLDFFDQVTGSGSDKIHLFQQNNNVAFYDFYTDADAAGVIDNKIRRFVDSRICEAFNNTVISTGAADDSGWNPNNDRTGLGFRYPWFKSLLAPGQDIDATQRITFEVKGSIILHTKTDTDYLSTIPSVKNH